MPGLRRRIVPQHREIRVTLRLAVVLRSEELERGVPAPRPLAGDGAHRGVMRELPQSRAANTVQLSRHITSCEDTPTRVCVTAVSANSGGGQKATSFRW